jgi:hypothetical protein
MKDSQDQRVIFCRCHHGNGARRQGWTLLELIISIGIIGLLLQLLFPAIQAAREAARQMQCTSHLRQIGLATLQYEQLQGHYPSAGWHFTWVGEPERGSGRRQPGGWAYQLLPYLEAADVHQMAKGLAGNARHQEIAERTTIPMPLFICPSRREAAAYPQTENQFPHTRDGKSTVQIGWAAKSDYAACVGDSLQPEIDWRWQGPVTLSEGDDPDFKWPDFHEYNGVVYGRSEVRSAKVRDGVGRTYLIGEKYLNPHHYRSGADQGDNENLYSGFDNDTCRSTRLPPRQDRAGLDWHTAFGSVHRSAWHAIMCDGSLHRIDYDIDMEVHRRFGTRYDRGHDEDQASP